MDLLDSPQPTAQFVFFSIALTMLLLPHWTLLCVTLDSLVVPPAYGRAFGPGVKYAELAMVLFGSLLFALLMQSIQLWWLEDEEEEEAAEAAGKAQQKKKKQ